MARGRKYKNLSPQAVAQMALDKLIDKIPQMIDDYAKAMNRFANDQVAQQRYLSGVSAWVTVMRSPEVRTQIANVVAQARARYMAMRGSATAPVYQAPTVPVTVPRTV